MGNNNTALKTAVQVLLNARGETMYSMAKAMGANPRSFGQSLNRDVRLSTIIKMAEQLGVTPGRLLDEVMKVQS